MCISIKVGSSSNIRKFETCSLKRATPFAQLGRMTLDKMVLLSAAIALWPTPCAHSSWVQTWTSSSGPMHSVMPFECPTRSQSRLDLNPPLHLQPANKKTSQTFKLLDVKFGLALWVIALLSCTPTLEKESFLVVSTHHSKHFLV